MIFTHRELIHQTRRALLQMDAAVPSHFLYTKANLIDEEVFMSGIKNWVSILNF